MSTFRHPFRQLKHFQHQQQKGPQQEWIFKEVYQRGTDSILG